MRLEMSGSLPHSPTTRFRLAARRAWRRRHVSMAALILLTGALSAAPLDTLRAQATGVAPVAGDPQTPGVRARSESSVDARLFAALDLQPGATVAEIGAGAGGMTMRASKLVGTNGRVYTTELGDERLRELRRAVEAAAATNVTVVEGDPLKANLPDGCCDALFMQNVYHHFGDPAAMNASLFRALKPGGRLAIADFAPDNGRSSEPTHRADNSHHGVTADTVTRELVAAGFEVIPTPTNADAPADSTSSNRGAFLVVLRKPGS